MKSYVMKSFHNLSPQLADPARAARRGKSIAKCSQVPSQMPVHVACQSAGSTLYTFACVYFCGDTFHILF